MKTQIDVEAATGGRFLPRRTAAGTPIALRVEGARLTIEREGGEIQTIDCLTGLGGVALCGDDGSVLGFGTLDIGDLAALADDVDGHLGKTSGPPLARLAEHGLRLVLPLDGMPAQVLGLFQLESIGPDLVADAAITDAHVADAARHDHDHDHDGECRTCARDAVEDVRTLVDDQIARHGHAVVGVTGGADVPAHSYTVGLADVGWPELVLVGMAGEQGRMILNAAVHALRSADRRPQPGLIVDDAVSVPLMLHAVGSSAARWTRVAADRRIRLGKPIDGHDAVQVLWPDASGRFPTDDDYDGGGLPMQVVIERWTSRKENG